MKYTGHAHVKSAAKGQAMTEFMFMAFVAFIILFVAIQMAALGREAMALGQLNYQVTRWATAPGNNTLKDASGNAVNSPQCTDVANLINGTTITNAYSEIPAVATGFHGKDRITGLAIPSAETAPAGGIGVAMTCVVCRRHAQTFAPQRPAGTGVQISNHGQSYSAFF